MKKDDIWYIIAMALMIIACLILIYVVKSPGAECMDSPLIYGAEAYSKGNNAELTCSCAFDKTTIKSFFFNSSDIWIEDQEIYYDFDINVSKLAQEIVASEG